MWALDMKNKNTVFMLLVNVATLIPFLGLLIIRDSCDRLTLHYLLMLVFAVAGVGYYFIGKFAKVRFPFLSEKSLNSYTRTAYGVIFLEIILFIIRPKM